MRTIDLGGWSGTDAANPSEDVYAAPPAEKILAGRDALQGERKQVTVLFADVVGSTS